MATFTFRIPDGMAGRLSSSDMRSWLAQFLRNPSLLPADPGSGSERISLTLQKQLVCNVADYLRCSPSIALRRLAASHLNVQGTPRVAAAHYIKTVDGDAVEAMGLVEKACNERAMEAFKASDAIVVN